jgi:hypothetical protein
VITAAEVGELRQAWVDLQAQVVAARESHAFSAGAESFDNTLGTDPTAGERALIGVVEAKERQAWLQYQDALARLQTQQAADQVAASNKLAAWNRNLAIVIAVATAAQAFYACKTFYKPDPPQCVAAPAARTP